MAVEVKARDRLSSWLGFGGWGFGIFFLLSLLYLLPLTLNPNAVPYPPKSEFTDLLISHLPNAEYLRDSLRQFGEIPLWNTQIFAGQPFAADPLAGLWYPPNWLLLILPLPFGFNLLFIFHLALAGYGLYHLLRAEGLPALPAFLGGLAFGGTPKLVAHIGAGHFGLVCAVAWTPLWLLAVKRAGAEPRLGRGAIAGACLALIFLADVRWAFYAGLLGAVYGAYLSLRRSEATEESLPRETKPSRWSLDVTFPKVLTSGLIIFLALTAVLTLPLAEFVRLSNRSALTLPEAAVFSLPPLYLLGLVIPNTGGLHEYMTYVGVIPLVLALLGLGQRKWFWGGVIVVAGAFALGSNFVLFPVLFRILPGLSLLRVPSRAWFVVALGMCILAAHGLQLLLSTVWPVVVRRYSITSPLLVRSLAPLLLVLTVLDLARVDSTLIVAKPRPLESVAAWWIASQPGRFRVYSPSYSLPPGDGVEHVDGVDPLQLAATVKWVEQASGVKAAGYSVTLPALDGDDIATANTSAIPDARFLGLLNVRFVVAEFPIVAPGLVLTQSFGRTQVFENAAQAARAWVELRGRGTTLESLSPPGTGEPARVTFFSPNRLEVEAEGPGQLVVSEMVYPGWGATVDGAATLIEGDGLRSVRLGPGRHEVVFEFRPLSVYGGALVSLLGLVGLVMLWRR